MKRIIGLIIGLVAALGFVGQANAYPPIKTATITTSNSSPAAGAPVTLTVNGFCANATVTFSAGGVTLGQATSDASGNASITIAAPTTVGAVVVTASTSGVCVSTASLTLTVRAPGGIPATGSSSSSSLQYGGLAVGLGAALVAFAGFKRRRPTAAVA